MDKSPETEIYNLKYGRYKRRRLMFLLLLTATTLVMLCGAVNFAFFAAGMAMGHVWPFSPPGSTAVPHMIAAYRVNQVVEPPIVPAGYLYSQSFDGRALPDWHIFSDGWDVQNGIYYGTNTRADARSEAVYGRGYQWADYHLEADVTASGTVAPSSAGLLFRYQENGYGGQCRLGTRASGQRQLELVTPEGQLVSTSFHYITGAAYRLRVTAVGSALTCEIIGYPDTRLIASTTVRRGTVGLQNQGITGAFDNLKVNTLP
ncbi:MAG: hypothetical protein KJ069_23690 [Anaerolineae bacterium]|nr:hypothetical protein [Anaerolineae bacterium]